MEEFKKEKIDRVLSIYTKLMSGYYVNKTEEAGRYGVNERTIQRDIDDIRNFLELEAEESGFINNVIYDREKKGYKLEAIYKLKLSNSEVLAICKILLDSRAFTKKEMEEIIKKLVDCCVPKINQKIVKELVSNEVFHYVEPQHKNKFIDKMWDIGQAIRHSKYIDIEYRRNKDHEIVKRHIKPVAIMFSEYYFYLTAFIDDEKVRQNFDVINDCYPTIYRIDRIEKLKVTNDTFKIPYNSRFEEGEFRKRVQFMYGGKLQRVEFIYSGNSIESVLDRLPTAKIIHEEDGKYTVSAEVFGTGIEMWIRSQGEMITDVKYK